ncbi:unnamed protein product [Linum tenue]|uniref:RING-type E3 ubiquitin transferase n=1 Tax=Linum tenue TaxID=586396 RepID=A0AAV0JPU4_9ROSI|nr:unnamed protein product [Linum tenue]
MMQLRTYASLSLVAALAVIYHAFSTRGQFYPAMVYLSTSKISLVLLLNMGLVMMCILWQLTKKVFLGTLREAEVERLNEQSWREVMEILFAITIFRQDFSVGFLAMVTALLLVKALHWLAQKRVEYIETTPSVPMRSQVRIVSFLGFLLLVDSLFLYSSIKYLIDTRQASVSLFFAFEYMILATTTVSTFVKYVFYVSDMLMEGQWERKAVYTFYLELIRDLLHLSMYLCFFLVIFMNYGVPLHLIRELYETFRNFKIRVADYLRYRKIASNMNDRFPDATPEELNASDATCIICREEMTTAKKLICGHLFHVHCLRSWLERQHTCPTCRALVVPPENGATTSGGQPGSWSNTNQNYAHMLGNVEFSAANSGSAYAQGSSGDGAADALSRHQARLQAAASAAAVYERSFVYPSPNTLVWSPGYALFPEGERPSANNISAAGGEVGVDGQSQAQFQFHAGPSNMPSLPQGPPVMFVPFQAAGGSNVNVLQSQLQLLEKPEAEVEKMVSTDSVATSSSDSKGKGVVSSSSSAPESHEDGI